MVNTPAVNQYQCPGCKADMAFDPDLGQLQCPYCGRAEAMPEVTATKLSATLQEHNLAAFIETNRTQIAQLAITAQAVNCPGCRATITFEPPDVAGKCPFCATSIVTQTSHTADPTLVPSGVVPFTVGRKIALRKLRDWLAFRWDLKDLKAIFLPGKLKQLAQNQSLTGVYLPFWTYDAQTNSRYRGERGKHYYETETYTTTNAQGERETKSRQVRRTRWYSASGQVHRFFDDVLIPATRAISEQKLRRLWPTLAVSKLKPYSAEYLAGFKAQRYEVPVKEGFERAKTTMAETIRRDIRSDIGGDEQRIHSVSTNYSKETFKHILLPVWMATYRYGGKTYQVMINAETGTVMGERPVAAWKVVLAVAIAALILGIVIVLAANG
ncbi:MAG: primosomal protein N' (replication factor Y) - superfamily II helicase [Cyanobacteria bacterium P01_H01_bin.105]